MQTKLNMMEIEATFKNFKIIRKTLKLKTLNTYAAAKNYGVTRPPLTYDSMDNNLHLEARDANPSAAEKVHRQLTFADLLLDMQNC